MSEEVKEVVEETTSEVVEELPEEQEEVVDEKSKNFGILGERMNAIIEAGAAQQHDEIVNKEEPTPPPEKPDDELPPADEEIPEKKPKMLPLEERSTDDLVSEVKKWMSIAEKRKVELERNEPNEKFNKFIDGLKTDFFREYESHHDEFGLPPIDYLKNQISSSGDRDYRIQQWQETQLIPAIEKKFKLEPGTFVSDPQDLYRKGTPTEMFRKGTADKEAEYDKEFSQQQQLKQETVKKITEQQEKDIAFLKENYYNGREENFEKDMEMFNGLSAKLSKGELPEEKNPFSVRNIYRGFYFNELAEALQKKAIDDIHAQYNSLGLFLPDDNNGKPTDVTAVKGSPSTTTKGPAKNKFSQQDRIFARYNH